MSGKYQEFRFQPMQNTMSRSSLPEGMIYRMSNATVEDGDLRARLGFGQYPKRLTTPSAWTNADICYGFGYGRYKTYEYYLAAIKPNGTSKTRIYVFDPSAATWATGTSDDWTQRTNSRWNFTTFDKYIYAVNETDGLWQFDMTAASPGTWKRANITLTSIVTPVSTAKIVKPPYETRLWSAANDTEAVTASGSGYDYATSVIDADGNWTLAGWVNKGTPTPTAAWFTCDIEDATSYDFSKKRYISAEVIIENPTLDTAGGSREQENPRILMDASGYQAYIADDATAPFGTWTDAKWKKCNIIATVSTTATGPDRVDGVRIDIDLDSSQQAATAPDLTVIKRIAIRIPLRSGNVFSLRMSPLEIGGTFLNKPASGNYLSLGESDPVSYYAATAKELAYLVQYFHTGTLAESAASKYLVTPAAAMGRSINGGMYLGAGVTFDLPAPSGAYNRVRLWRQRRSDSNRWYLLEDNAAAVTVTDYLVDAAGDPVAWPATYRESGATFGAQINQDISPDCVTTWKTHMVIGADNLIYFSEANVVTNYYFAPDDERNPTKGSIDTTDTTLGRTLYMSNDRSDSCLGFVSKDILYAVGRRGVYAFIGDSAVDGSGFRKLPGSYGAVSNTAIAEYQDGVLVGSQSGLYYHQASRALAVFNDFSTASVEELTKTVRPSWRSLLTTNADNELVICEDGEGGILCIRGSRYMYLNPSGHWEEGTLSEDALLDGDPNGGTGDGGDGVDINPGDGDIDVTPGEEDPIEGTTEVCYSDSSLFTIAYSWSGSSTGAAVPTDWSLPNNTASHSAAKDDIGTSSSGTLTASGTLTITITYIGGNPKPTHVYVKVTSDCLASATAPDYTTGYHSTVTVAISDGLGTSTYYGTNVQNSKDINAEGARTYRLNVVGTAATLALSVSGSASATTSSFALDGASLAIQAAHVATIMPCGSPVG